MSTVSAATAFIAFDLKNVPATEPVQVEEKKEVTVEEAERQLTAIGARKLIVTGEE